MTVELRPASPADLDAATAVERAPDTRRWLGDAAVEHAFARRGTHRLWLDVKPRNTAARSLYRSVGFVEEGTLREAMPEPDGSFSSLVVMSLLDRESAALSGVNRSR